MRSKTTSPPAPWFRVTDWTKYLKAGTNLYMTGADILGNPYGAQPVDTLPQVPAATKTALSDVTDDTFWSPYKLRI